MNTRSRGLGVRRSVATRCGCDSDINEALAAATAATVLAADTAWHEGAFSFARGSNPSPTGAENSACEFQRTDSRAAERGECGKKLGAHS